MHLGTMNPALGERFQRVAMRSHAGLRLPASDRSIRQACRFACYKFFTQEHFACVDMGPSSTES